MDENLAALSQSLDAPLLGVFEAGHEAPRRLDLAALLARIGLPDFRTFA
jgi:hypothetical protein